MIRAPESAVPGIPDATLDALYARSGAHRWGLDRTAFAAGVRAAAARRPAGADGADALASGLHVEDVALAIACAEGLPAAWDHFVLTFRPELYRAARAMTDDATGRELADSLYADLFGLSERDGVRRSLFRYYQGRARLATWLRSVLAQRHVDLIRARRRTSSLDATGDDGAPASDRLPAPATPDAATVEAMRVAAVAVTDALATLAPDDRRRLAYYYVHGLKLLAIGAQFNESEATASRKLERARQTLRQAIEQALAALGLRATDVDDWAAVTRQAWDATLAEALGVPAPQDAGASSFKGKRTP